MQKFEMTALCKIANFCYKVFNIGICPNGCKPVLSLSKGALQSAKLPHLRALR
jgi:hypothetical protein